MKRTRDQIKSFYLFLLVFFFFVAVFLSADEDINIRKENWLTQLEEKELIEAKDLHLLEQWLSVEEDPSQFAFYLEKFIPRLKDEEAIFKYTIVLGNTYDLLMEKDKALSYFRQNWQKKEWTAAQKQYLKVRFCLLCLETGRFSDIPDDFFDYQSPPGALDYQLELLRAVIIFRQNKSVALDLLLSLTADKNVPAPLQAKAAFAYDYLKNQQEENTGESLSQGFYRQLLLSQDEMALLPSPLFVHLSREEVQETPLPKSSPAAESSPVAVQAGQYAFFVQLGAFGEIKNSQSLINEIQDMGFAVSVREKAKESGGLYKVGVYCRTRDEAQKIMRKIKAAGYSAFIVGLPE